jgi:hypothetical protein
VVHLGGHSHLDRNYVPLSSGVSGLTSGRVAIVGSDGGITDDAGLTFNASTNALTCTGAGTFGGLLTASLGLSIADAQDITISATTGTKIGQSTSKIGLFGATPVVQRAAYTQTYSSVSRTVGNPTAAALTLSVGTADGTIADVGGAFSQTTLNNNFRDCGDQINKLIADVANIRDLIGSLIDDSQAIGVAQ